MPEPTTPASRAGTADPVLYSERLWPSLWVWVVAIGVSAAGILVFAPITLAAGYTAAVVIFIVLGGALIASTPVVRVTARTFQAGRATLPLEFAGRVEAFRGEEATAERGPRLNGLAYLCLRGWISPVVRVELTDPDDRTPYWLVSSRHPDKLVAALAESSRTA
ncbi:hypothetical protein GCM10012320_03360 [Sinomonas cellulolyticus]|uniref:DUF3093 domain-containing protein n=1 Tax=Sinomonas cellulolyticus TaxID=2801916 RepID=A0ABS1K1W9_9MICC|nr:MULTISPECIES: DUF3093 domain-containing protein [Sinomonas]MBL0705448.1 DUF3093 domain-containing protein [Sinomonas cellulolyticus]GHG41230.1 hypothetical protein GCM10012320_03360 [Sinomonas sp. KCTC 49339]